MTWRILQGDCVEVMRGMAECSVDAVVCDPPYGLEFMGKEWDRLGDIGKTSHSGASKDPAGGFYGGTKVSYSGSSNVKCRRCQKWKWDREGRKCECQPFGDFPNVGAHQARLMQDWHQAWATEALRVLKPGGHLLAFGGTRTSHRLACAIEDAGFEIRDTISWLYGSGFPKSLDVSKAIDKAAEINVETEQRIAVVGQVIREHRERKGLTPQEVSEAVVGTPSGACWNWEHVQLPSLEKWAALKPLLGIPDRFDALVDGDRSRFIEAEREVVGPGGRSGRTRQAMAGDFAGEWDSTAPATPGAQQWQGWGTALKPSHEPIIVARKPLSGTVAATVQEFGTGALNVDGCRVEHRTVNDGNLAENPHLRESITNTGSTFGANGQLVQNPSGRWPANTVLSHSEGCRSVGTRRVKGSAPASGPTLTGESESVARGTFNGVETTPSYADPDGTEQVEAWDCAEGCPIAELDAQSGERRSAGLYDKGSRSVGDKDSAASIPVDGLTSATYTDSGGASRFFATFRRCGDELTEAVPTSDGASQGAERSDLSSSTAGSGSRPMAPSRSATTSTTETATDSTTRSETSNSSNEDVTRTTTGRHAPLPSSKADCDDAPDAQSGSHSVSSPREPMVPASPIAPTVGMPTSESGELGTESATPPICAPIEQSSEPRFRYQAKASRAERNAGLEGFEERTADPYGEHRGRRMEDKSRIDGKPAKRAQNPHPTVKPLALMRWLVRLVTPLEGVVLDPFAGSGTTGCAAALEGFNFIGIEREAEYVEIAEARIAYWSDPKAHDDRLAEARREQEQAAAEERGEPVQLGLLV